MSRVIFFCFVSIVCFSQKSNAQKEAALDFGDAIKEIKKGKDSNQFIKALKGRNNRNLDSALYYNKEARRYSILEKDSTFIPLIYYYLSQSYRRSHDYDLAHKYLDSLAPFIKKTFKVFPYYYHYSRGITYNYQRNYNWAIEHYLLAEKSTTKINQKLLTLESIGILYLAQGKYDLAKVFSNRVFEVFDEKKIDFKRDSTQIVYNFKTAALVADTFEEAIKYAKTGIKLAEKVKSTGLRYRKIIEMKRTAGRVYLKFRKYDDAIIEFNNALKIAKINNNRAQLGRNYKYLAESYYEKAAYKTSLKYIDSFEYSNSGNYITSSFAPHIGVLKYKNYYQTGNIDSVLYYANKSLHLRDSLLNVKTEKHYKEAGVKFQTEQKIRENKILQQDVVIKNLTIEKQKNRQNLILIITSISIIGLFIIFYQLSQKRRINSSLQKAIKVKEKFFSIIAHDLINPFNTVLGFSDLLKSDYEKLSKVERVEYINVINKGVKHNYDLTRNLLNWAKMQQDEIKADKEDINILNLIEESIAPSELILKKKNIELVKQIDVDKNIYLDPMMTKTIINNLISNAIKFSHPGSKIFLTAKIDNNSLYVEIKDQGVGIDEHLLKTIFNEDRIRSKKGTLKEKGTGLGLSICKKFVEIQNGIIELYSKPNEGTTVVLKFVQ